MTADQGSPGRPIAVAAFGFHRGCGNLGCIVLVIRFIERLVCLFED